MSLGSFVPFQISGVPMQAARISGAQGRITRTGIRPVSTSWRRLQHSWRTVVEPWWTAHAASSGMLYVLRSAVGLKLLCQSSSPIFGALHTGAWIHCIFLIPREDAGQRAPTLVAT